MSRAFENGAAASSPEDRKGKHEIDVFPQGDAYLNSYRLSKENSNEPIDEESVEVLREVLYMILDEGIRNSRLYHSEKMDTDFPYTTFKLGSVARSIFLAQGGMREAVTANESEPHASKREVIFTGIPSDIKSGGQFEWSEFVMEELLRKLPQALEDLRQGKDPEDYEASIAGYPTNEFGSVSEAFLQKMKEEGLSIVGELYADWVEEQRNKENESEGKKSLLLKGVSLGSSIAAQVAQELLTRDLVTQNGTSESFKPEMRVQMYSPAAMLEMNTSPLRVQQKYGGIGLEYLYNINSPSTKLLKHEMPDFIDKMRKKLEYRMPLKTTDEQLVLKNDVIAEFKVLASQGSPIPSGVKATVIQGDKDTLTFSLKRNRELAEHKKNHSGTLGEGLTSRINPDVRVFNASMAHQLPFYRNRVITNFDRAVAAIKGLKKRQDLQE
jgi:hypothetical protein